MNFLGSWKIDDYLPIPAVTHRFSSGAAYDATSITYSIYEFATDGTPTEIVTDTAMTKRDSKTGFYVDVVQLTAAAGFDKGGRYVVYVAATVDSVTAIDAHVFQIEAEVDANVVSDKTGYTASTVSDKTGYTLTQTFPTNFADLSISATTGIVQADVALIEGGPVSGEGGALASASDIATASAAAILATPANTLTTDAAGHVTLADGAHGGSSAVLTLRNVVVATSAAGESAVSIAATGTGNAHAVNLASTNAKAMALGSTNSTALSIDSAAADAVTIGAPENHDGIDITTSGTGVDINATVAGLSTTERTAIGTALLAIETETGITLKTTIQAILAAVAGELAESPAGTWSARDYADALNRIVWTTDATGRLTVTINADA